MQKSYVHWPQAQDELRSELAGAGDDVVKKDNLARSITIAEAKLAAA